MIPPVGYLDLLSLLNGADLVISDSGGIQQETMALKKRCVRVMNRPSFPEIMEYPGIISVPPKTRRINSAIKQLLNLDDTLLEKHRNPLGNGDAARKIVKAVIDFIPGGTEHDADYYNDFFQHEKRQEENPKKSIYYKLWRHIVNKLLTPGERILDIGCGSSLFGRLCTDNGHGYIGVDFSKDALSLASRNVPTGRFHRYDMNEDLSVFQSENYSVVTFLEFLEHIERDRDVVAAIPPGKRVIFSVPNYWAKNHVRRFPCPKDIYKRYGDLLEFQGEAFRLTLPNGALVFVCEAIKK